MMLAGSAEVASVTRMTHHGNTDEHSGSGRHPVQRVHRPHFNDVVSRVLSRRGFLKAGLGAGAVGFMGAGLTACGSDDDDDSPAKPTTPGKPTPEQPKPVDLNFKAVPVSTADTVVVPEGYQYAVLNRWGDPLFAGAPPSRPTPATAAPIRRARSATTMTACTSSPSTAPTAPRAAASKA